LKALVIAGGPNVNKQFKEAKNFRGIILTVDKMLKPCIDAGIIPNYVMTIENISIFGYFFKDIPRKYAEKITVIVSGRTHLNTVEVIQAHGFKHIVYTWKFLSLTSNVGLMAVVYCWDQLKIYEIIIIGFDHCDYKRTGIPCFNEKSPQFKIFYIKIENPHTKTVCYLDPIHQLWYEQFFDFMKLAPIYPHVKIINCTGNGALFGGKIEWSHLKAHLKD